MKPLILCFAVMGFVLSSNVAEAQIGWYRQPGVVVPYYTPYGAGWGYYGPAGYSPVEGYQRGMADVIRARGQAAEAVARARLNNEQARRQYLENQAKWNEIYWERRRRGEAERARDHAEARERRQRWLETRRDRQPETVPPSQYDSQTGDIQWPEALQRPAYAEQRAEIEEELELQARTGTTSNAPRIRALAREMQDRLKGEVRNLPANDYLAARKFLDRLINQMALAQHS